MKVKYNKIIKMSVCEHFYLVKSLFISQISEDLFKNHKKEIIKAFEKNYNFCSKCNKCCCLGCIYIYNNINKFIFCFECCQLNNFEQNKLKSILNEYRDMPPLVEL
jgi:hypothetical protein